MDSQTYQVLEEIYTMLDKDPLTEKDRAYILGQLSTLLRLFAEAKLTPDEIAPRNGGGFIRDLFK